jgi:hypothetical protein
VSISPRSEPEPFAAAPPGSRTADEAAVQARCLEQLKAYLQDFASRYRTEFGNHFNPDNAAELFEDYSSSAENRAKYRIAVSPAAGALADEAFKRRLAEPDKTPVVFTAGGTASGKSTVAAPAAEDGLVVFDSTFSNYELSKARLQQALDSGRRIVVLYLYRDPAEAWEAAKDRTDREGAGRAVTPKAHSLTHQGAAETVARLAMEFANHPQVAFQYFANSTAAGLRPGGIELAAQTTMRPVDRVANENVPGASNDMPAGLSIGELQNLTEGDLGDYLDRIAIAAVAECRSNKDLFLKRHPRLDFRGKRPRLSDLKTSL